MYPALDVDKYQTVAFDDNQYSIPRPFAHRTVMVKAYIDQAMVVSPRELVATYA
jgi:hypothetical protein